MTTKITKTNNPKPEPYLIEYVIHDEIDNFSDGWGIIPEINEVVAYAERNMVPWAQKLFEPDARTLVMFLTRPLFPGQYLGGYGQTLIYAHFENAE